MKRLETNDELFFVSLRYAASVADIFVHQGLSEAWFVQFVVAPATVGNQVNYDVLFNGGKNGVRSHKRVVIFGTPTLRKKLRYLKAVSIARATSGEAGSGTHKKNKYKYKYNTLRVVSVYM